MSKLHFKCDFKSYQLQSLALPVEVRKSNLALVAQTLSTQSVNVAPGTYHITAKLPAGQELYNQVTVMEGQDEVTAFLMLDPDDESPNESLEVQRYITGQPAESVGIPKGLESLGWDETTAKLRVINGNILQGPALAGNALGWFQPQPAPAPGMAKFSCRPGDVRLAQLLQPEAPPINLVLPLSLDPPHDCQLVLIQQSTGLLSMEAHLEHLGAETLLRYAEKGLLEQAATTSVALDAERLLAQKGGDPIAAAVGAYALLRFGELDRLHTWTENLKNWFTWLPDGIPIRAEHLARLGEHHQALVALLELPQRGLPIFSEGLSYAINRLRLYVSHGKSDFTLEERSQAEALLEKLQRFANFVDFRRPILTFTGLRPDQPSDEPFTEDIEMYKGLDVAEHLG